jgi:excisionase family DNA binding protein
MEDHAHHDPADLRPLTRADVLSTSEVAELLGMPRSTVHELARRGDLPARRVGRRWLFLRDRIAAAIAPLDEPGAWRPRQSGATGKINGVSLRAPQS